MTGYIINLVLLAAIIVVVRKAWALHKLNKKMNGQESKHCLFCGNTHSGICSDDYSAHFQCECGQEQKIPYDVIGFTSGSLLIALQQVANEAGQASLGQKDLMISLIQKQAYDLNSRQLEIIAQQAVEIEALRGFSKAVIDGDCEYANIHDYPMLYKLIDENGNPTKLLTGDDDN